MPVHIVQAPIARSELLSLAPELGDMVKAVVDIERGIMAIGGEMQSDEEAILLDDGSRQVDLWGNTRDAIRRVVASLVRDA